MISTSNRISKNRNYISSRYGLNSFSNVANDVSNKIKDCKIIMTFTAMLYRNCCLATPRFLTLRCSSDPSIKDKPPLGQSGKKQKIGITTNQILRLFIGTQKHYRHKHQDSERAPSNHGKSVPESTKKISWL